jgi:long-chain acyl-CoA synthetase
MKTTHGLHRSLLLNRSGIAIHLPDGQLTWEEVGERVARMAGALRALGVEPGDRVAVLMFNQHRYIELYLAVAWAGGVIVPLNTRWSSEENEFAVRDCGPRAIIVDHAFSHLTSAICADADPVTVIYADDAPNPSSESMIEYEALIDGGQAIADVECSPDDLAGIFYTGGTTGRPKGVMLSHRNLVSNSRNWLGEGLAAQGHYLNLAPMFHLANTAAMYAAMLSGAAHSVMPAFTPQGTIEAIEKYGVTDTLLVPTMLQMLVDYPGLHDHDLSSLRRIIYAASPINEAVLDRAMTALPHVELAQAYGMTELSPCVTFLPWRDHVEGRARNLHRSAGRPTYCVDVGIIGDDGRRLPPGEVGEVIARGETVMLGYWNRPEETAKAVVDGWMHTGDGGYMTEDGYLFLVDRIKDMIITGGENVYSAEVENVIARHPAVAQCAVIGRPHAKWGETVHAVIARRPQATLTEQEIIAFCRQQIAGYKCPTSASIQDDPLPMSGAGKILKRLLRDNAA